MTVDGVQSRSANELCCQCGLCCVMLSARVTDDEVKKLAESCDALEEEVSHVEKVGPNVGHRVLTFPCQFLLGTPCSYVRCLAYEGFRPEVCRTYLCRVALQYKMGLMELDDALRLLRRAYELNRVELFNWITDSEHDEALARVSIVPTAMERAQQIYELMGPELSMDRTTLERLVVAESITPRFKLISDKAIFLYMFFDVFDRGDLELEDILGKEAISGWTEEERLVAEETLSLVMQWIRDYFEKD